MNKFHGVSVVLATVLMIGCGGGLRPPPTFIRTLDEAGTWRSIEVRSGLEGDELWTTTVDAMARSFDLEVMDKPSGYIRTSWKFTFIRSGEVIDRYRARIVVKFQGTDWTTLEVKSEANWLSDRGWEVGYDSRLLEDVFGDLQGRLGRVRR